MLHHIMDRQLLFICGLTFVIHLIGTLAYSVRIAGVRTRRIAVSFALFNVLVLISRTSNSFQGPFLAKRIESSLSHPIGASLLSDFRWLLLSATLATIVGAVLIPTFQRFFTRAVHHFQIHRSIPRLIYHIYSKGGLSQFRDYVRVPDPENITQLRVGQGISVRVVIMNVLAVALWTVATFSSLYAGYLNPEVRVTASQLAAIINGIATIILFVFLDPQMSIMTDDLMDGRVSESSFRQAIVWLVGSRFVGTVLAQALLLPAATLISFIAQRL